MITKLLDYRLLPKVALIAATGNKIILIKQNFISFGTSAEVAILIKKLLLGERTVH